MLGLAGESPRRSIPTRPTVLAAERRARRSGCRSQAGARSPSIRRPRSCFDIVTPTAAPSEHPAPRRPRRRAARRSPTRPGSRSAAVLSCATATMRAGPGTSGRPLSLPLRRRASRARPRAGLSIAELMRANEAALRPEAEVDARLGARARRRCSPASTAASRRPARCRAASRSSAGRKAIYERLIEAAAPQPAPGPRDHGFRQRLRDGGQRGERRRRPRRHRADQRRGRRHSGGPALLPRPLRGRDASRASRDFLLTADGDRRPLQAQRLDLRGRGRLPGRGRRRLVDGGRGPVRGARRLERADRERRRDRHGASSRHDLRSGRRPRADPLHRAQRLRRGQGDRRRLARAARRRRATAFRSTA